MASFLAFLLLVSAKFLFTNGTPASVTIPKEDMFYTAAVFEHTRLGNWTTQSPSVIIAENIDFFERATVTAKAKGADIIAFPEYGLIPFLEKREEMRKYLERIPDPKKGHWNPCMQTEEFSDRAILRALSCIASENQIVLVVNMGDIQSCTKEETEKCPNDGYFHFNANVAFGRNGTIIGVYRKEHLFFEVSMDLPIEPQDPIFHTDFGTFAMYICFEVHWKRMALSGRNQSVDAVVFTTQWIDSRPLLTSIQHWISWSYGNDGILLAANGQLPGIGAAGSGIFDGKKGPLVYTFNSDGVAKLIVSKVPKRAFRDVPFDKNSSITVITAHGTEPYVTSLEDEGKNIPDVCDWSVLGETKDIYKDYRCFTEKTGNYTFLKLEGPEGHLEACNNGLCCSVDYSADSMDETFYLGVFNGTHNSFNRYYWCEEKCFVVRCDAFNGTECNTFPAASRTVFKKLEIKANFTTNFTYPSVIKSGFRLSPVDEWSFNIDKENDAYTGRLVYENDNEKPMLVAAINARCYDRDPPYTR